MAENASMTNDIQKLSEEISEEVKTIVAKESGEEISEKINFQHIQNAIKSAKSIITKKGFEVKGNEDILKSIYKLVFMLRQVFTNVEYSFQIGIDAKLRETKFREQQKFLIEYEISQNELFSDMSKNFQISTSGDLKLASKLENQSQVIGEENQTTKKEAYWESNQSQLSQHWKDLTNSLALPSNFKLTDDDFTEEDGKYKTVYLPLSKQSTNKVVLYHRFSKKEKEGGKETRSFYFSDGRVDEKGDIKMIYFNEGWLYEWGKAFEASGGFKKRGKVSIEKILAGQHMDNLRGYLYGDYYKKSIHDPTKFQAVQAKKNNSKIMSFKDLLTTLDDLSRLMTELSKQKDAEKISKIIKKYFGIKRKDNKDFAQGVSKFVNKSINDAAENLKNIFSG